MTEYPKNNSTREGIITNMCYTWDHAFGVTRDADSPDVIDNYMGYTTEERDFFWRQMAQIYDNDIAPFMRSTFRTNAPYDITIPDDGWKLEFTDEEKQKLRPIAETLAMLDGNAFFGISVGSGNTTTGQPEEWYESYLAEAHALYEANGGDKGAAGSASFAKRFS